MSKIELFAHIFSFVIIIAYSKRFFNQPLYSYSTSNARFREFVLPVEPRLMTEYHAYKFFRFVFICLLLFIYVVLFATLSNINGKDMDGFAKSAANLLGDYKFVTSILSMLAIVGVTQYPKWLSSLISDLRELLHEQARIPLKGHELFNHLLHTRINYSTPEAQLIIEKLMKDNPIRNGKAREDVVLDDFDLENRKDILWKWAKLSYLLKCLDEDLKLTKYKSYETEYKLGLSELQHEYIELIDDVIEYRNRKQQWSSKNTDKLREEIRKLVYKACRMIACFLILTADPKADPKFWLKKYAYEVEVENRKYIKPDYIKRSLILVIASFVLAAALFSGLYNAVSPVPIDLTLTKFVTQIIQLVIIMVLPLYYIVVMKKRLSIIETWPSVLSENDERSFAKRPWSIYFGLAFVVWLVTNICASGFSWAVVNSGLTKGAINSYVDLFFILWPFTFISFVITVMSAYRLDTPPLDYACFKSYSRYVFQAVMQGIMVVIIIMVGFSMANLPEGTKLLPMSYYYTIGFAAGFSANFAFQLSGDSYEEVDSEETMQAALGLSK